MKHKISRIGLLTVIPLLLIAFALLPMSEADAFESEENIIKISNSTLELVSDEDYITPIIVIISVEQ